MDLRGAARRRMLRSGGTPPKKFEEVPPVPLAPNVATRQPPGTVPMRKRGFHPLFSDRARDMYGT